MKHRVLDKLHRPDGSQGLARRSAGFTILELMVTLILLASVMATVVPLLSWVNAQRRAADARQVAVQEATNILERFSARDWDDVSQPSAIAVKLSADTAESLRDARLKVTVHWDPQQPTAKRITVELRWKNREGDELSPVRLTGFVFRKTRKP